MLDPALSSQQLMRMGSFAGVFVVMALWEVLAPRRSQAIGRAKRWPGNLGIVVLDTLFVRLLIPAGAVGAALVAQAQGWGLFNVVAVPDWASVGLSVLLLDLAIYAQHIIFHKIPLLWRLHRVHHADVEFDVSTGVRFHPAETLLSMLIKATVVIALGAPPSAVLIFEVVLNATAMFNHGNVRLPRSLDWCLRLLVVTPDMHRVHHSVVPRETDSNFGFNVPWWDRLFGTYRPQPEAGHDGMTIGLDQFRDIGDLRLDRMLIQPFRSNRGRASATAPRSKVP